MPVIAVIDGYALGAGMVIASLCDLRIASDEARFGLPEIAGGTVGGARHLLRVLPQGTVRHLALTGEHLSAERARQLGFVEQVRSDRRRVGKEWVRMGRTRWAAFH